MSPDGTGTTASLRTRIDYLEKLGAELVKRGFRARLTCPAGRAPSLYVTNPAAAALTEHILAEGGTDGWWFWWSWAERIAVADDVPGAAEQVAKVLDVNR